MAEEAIPYGRKTQRPSPVKEVHILWITAGLSCDGDSISITAATQPSIENVLLGAIPRLPKVHLHNPVLAYEIGGIALLGVAALVIVSLPDIKRYVKISTM